MSASSSEIKNAYRAAAKKYHPDINQGQNTEALFQEINEAYRILSDKNKRAQYDYLLAYQLEKAKTVAGESQSSRRHSESELLRRKKRAYEVIRQRERQRIEHFKKQQKLFPYELRYVVGFLIMLWGVVMVYNNWFINYASSADILSVSLGIMMIAGGILFGCTHAYTHLFMMHKTRKLNKSYENLTISILVASALLASISIYAGVNIKRHAELTRNYTFSSPKDFIKRPGEIEFEFTFKGQTIRKRQSFDYNGFINKEELVVRHSKSNPSIARIEWIVKKKGE